MPAEESDPRKGRGGRGAEPTGEELIAAFDEAGRAGDDRTRERLAATINARFSRILRASIGRRLPNDGLDVIEAARGVLLDALLLPDTADGRGLRVAFGPRIRMRAVDAIRQSKRWGRERISPDEAKSSKAKTDANGPDRAGPGTGGLGKAAKEAPESGQDPWGATNDLLLARKVIGRIPEGPKRKALIFYFAGWTMAEAADALGRSESTVRLWLEELRRATVDLRGEE